MVENSTIYPFDEMSTTSYNSSGKEVNLTRVYHLFTAGYISIVLNMLSIAICVLVLIFSFWKNGRSLFQWKIVQRAVILATFCDLMFYGTQGIFGIHVTITREVPWPITCSVYAGVILGFAFAQCRLSTIIAFSACYMIFTRKQLEFGKYDWKLLLIMFLDPIVTISVAATAGGMEFNGIYCGLKEGHGVLWNFLLIFLPLVLVLSTNVILYIILWMKIYLEGNSIKSTIGEQSVTSHRIMIVTRKLTFFILVFILRFTLPAIHGAWVFIENPPKLLYQILSFATCSGGIFNGLFYLTIYRGDL